MAAQEMLEAITIAFNPSLQPSPSEPPAAYAAVAAQLKAAPGVNGVYIGRQHERPGLWTVFIRWSDAGAYDAFVASEAFTPWYASLKAVLIDDESPEAKELPPRGSPVRMTVASGSVDVALSAPTTEVFSCFGIDPGFLEGNLKAFAEGLEGGNIAGFHGLALCSHSYEGSDQPEGDAAKLLIGWDNKEAHFAVVKQTECALHHGHVVSTLTLCETTVVAKYLPLVSSGRKDVDMVSCPFL